MSTEQAAPAPVVVRLSTGRKILRVVLALGLALMLLIGGLLAFASTRPDEMHIERTADVKAPALVVFNIINNLQRWSEWSPYDKFDPNMKKSFKGPQQGPGAIYEWNGNGNVGEGRLTITDSKPGEIVTMKLEFTRPFNCNNQVNFRLTPTDKGTQVSWIMDGKNTLMSKVMGIFMDMDAMVGGDFVEGLKNLDKVAQADAAK